MRIYKLFTSASALALALVCTLFASGTAQADVDPQSLVAPDAGAYIQQVASQLNASDKHVLLDLPSPESPAIMTPDEQMQLEQDISSRGHPIYIVSLNAWKILANPSAFNSDPSSSTVDAQYEAARMQVLAATVQQFATAAGKPGVYVVFTGWELGFSVPAAGNTAGAPVIGNVGMPVDLMPEVKLATLWYSSDASLVSSQPGINSYPILRRFVSQLNETHIAPPALDTGKDAAAYRSWMALPATTAVGTAQPQTSPDTVPTATRAAAPTQPSASSSRSGGSSSGTVGFILLMLLVLGGPLLGCIAGTIVWVVLRRKRRARRLREAAQRATPPAGTPPFGTMEGQQRVTAGTSVPPAPAEHIPPMHPEHPSAAVTPAHVPLNGQAAPGSIVASSVEAAEDATMPISVIPSTTPLPGDPDASAPGSTPAEAGTSAD